jgi:hypothetical protein
MVPDQRLRDREFGTPPLRRPESGIRIPIRGQPLPRQRQSQYVDNTVEGISVRGAESKPQVVAAHALGEMPGKTFGETPYAAPGGGLRLAGLQIDDDAHGASAA